MRAVDVGHRQQQIIDLMERAASPLTVQQICNAIEAADATVRHALVGLQRRGLVTWFTAPAKPGERRRRGRPAKLWEIDRQARLPL